MLRRIGHGQAGKSRQVFDAALSLPHEFQQFQPVPISERLGYNGKLREQRALRVLT
jgi:hypothetical protein